MNTPTEMTTERGVLSQLMSMVRTRIELAAIDVEAHVQATLMALMTAFAAVVLGLIAFAFIGVAVIVFFWETHRIAAAIGTMLAYVALATIAAMVARSGWKSRPPAFAATIHELELDREAFGGRP